MPYPSTGEWESFLSNLDLKYPLENKLAFEIIRKMERVWKDVRPYDTLIDKLDATSTADSRIQQSMLFHVMIIAFVKHFMEIESMK